MIPVFGLSGCTYCGSDGPIQVWYHNSHIRQAFGLVTQDRIMWTVTFVLLNSTHIGSAPLCDFYQLKGFNYL